MIAEDHASPNAVLACLVVLGGGFALVSQAEAGEGHAGEADAEFLHRCAPRDRLGHLFCEFIEFRVHVFPSFGCLVLVSVPEPKPLGGRSSIRVVIRGNPPVVTISFKEFWEFFEKNLGCEGPLHQAVISSSVHWRYLSQPI